MKLKRLTILVAALFCLSTITALAAEEEMPFEVDAKAAILVDATSGQVICEFNADEQFDIAGASKVMSMLVLAESIEDGLLSLSDKVNVSTTATNTGGMSAFLEHGEDYIAEELFNAVLTVNANDATLALVEKAFGSQNGLLKKISEKSKELGIAPNFVNVTGHNASGQAMSAREAAVIACELAKYDTVLSHGTSYSDTIEHPSGRVTELVNPNKLVRFYQGCDGFATGSSSGSGYSGVFTASRSGQRYITVVIGARNSNTRADIAKKLLDHAFANYESILVIEEGKGVAKDIPIDGGVQKTVHGVASQGLSILTKKGEASQITKTSELLEGELKAPVVKGDVVGYLVINKGDVLLKRIPIVAFNDVEKASLYRNFTQLLLDYLRR